MGKHQNTVGSSTYEKIKHDIIFGQLVPGSKLKLENIQSQYEASGDDDWEGNLVAAHHKLQLIEKKMIAGDVSEKETWKRYDWEFHLAVIEACNSKNLLELHSILYDKYLRYQMLVFTFRGDEAAQEHHKIFEAALSRNGTEAARLLEAHIVNGLEHTLAAM